MMNKEVSEFLNPIDPNNPSGENIRYLPVYQQIHKLRDPNIKKKDLDYLMLQDLCEDLLKTKTKDLHIGAILTEAWSILYGLDGLNMGLDLMIGLCHHFWDNLYPENLNDIEPRLSVFLWMNEKLPNTLLTIFVTQPEVTGGVNYTLANLIDARQLELLISQSGLKKTDIIEQAKNERRPTLDEIIKSMKITSINFYEALISNIHKVFHTIKTLEDLLDEKFKQDSITFKGFYGSLNQLDTYAQQVLQEKKLHPQMSEHIYDIKNMTHVNEVSLDLKKFSADELYELLDNIAASLADIDPKSLAPKLIRKAIKWGNMSVPDFLNDLNTHDIHLDEINKLLKE